MARKKEKDPAKRLANLKQQENKTPEMAAAKKAFETYFKENGLDPTKDYTKDPVHGAKVTKLINKLNKERDKLAARFPYTDPKGYMKKIRKEAIKKVKREQKVDALQKRLIAEKRARGEEVIEPEIKPREGKAKDVKVTKYEYPLIEGREMTSEEKRKFRANQRRLMKKGSKPMIENASSERVNKGKKAVKVKRHNKVKKTKVNKEED